MGADPNILDLRGQTAPLGSVSHCVSFRSCILVFQVVRLFEELFVYVFRWFCLMQMVAVLGQVMASLRLFYAVAKGRVETAEALVKGGAGLDAPRQWPRSLSFLCFLPQDKHVRRAP